MAEQCPLAVLREEGGDVFELGPVPTSCPAGMSLPWETGRYFLWRPDFLKINVFILVLFATPFSVAVQG